ncbi:DUF4931 domain-containing protein [Hazenella sp. IB182357]|uniref:DUF4931 domain-containing protein n=2 Tax=Polycladospora coralii TaxID=2771432 RepID=A0A926RTB5_9BACL|nr:DUF4931 domain-containing protein [Polycladospora coralii]MBD1372615.1 DUF4931 domain-containing protein [Polycladospora coralii]MBS7531277.1 DUF4931 domain-containing protein [Polycladospora coralii]
MGVIHIKKQTHLKFRSQIGRRKPENIVNVENACPFCDRESLEGIIAEEDSILLLKNKYPVIENADQTVLVESDHCEGDLSTYSKDHLYRLVRFGINQWLSFEQSGRYQSVLFFKNHGPLSGGSMRHPHMQIIGLYDVDYQENIDIAQFEGIPIHIDTQVELNLSTKPRAGFIEFNVIISDLAATHRLADHLQNIVHYVRHHMSDSYNLFFYHCEGKIAVKIVPRYVMSPIYVGFSLVQVPDSIEERAEQVRKLYYSHLSQSLT